jgi:DNA-binding GntR family transcriptional regulator
MFPKSICSNLDTQMNSPKSKTNEGMDEMLAALQASSSNEAAKHAIEHMEHPFQHVKRPQVRTIDRIIPNNLSIQLIISVLG